MIQVSSKARTNLHCSSSKIPVYERKEGEKKKGTQPKHGSPEGELLATLHFEGSDSGLPVKGTV